MKPFSTYPEDRAKAPAAGRGYPSRRQRHGWADAIELADLVRAILEDEAVAIDMARGAP